MAFKYLVPCTHARHPLSACPTGPYMQFCTSSTAKVLGKKSIMREGGPESEGGGDLNQQIKFLPPYI